jgi:hypothetical protein
VNVHLWQQSGPTQNLLDANEAELKAVKAEA